MASVIEKNGFISFGRFRAEIQEAEAARRRLYRLRSPVPKWLTLMSMICAAIKCNHVCRKNVLPACRALYSIPDQLQQDSISYG